jgi:hypothetical protein
MAEFKYDAISKKKLFLIGGDSGSRSSDLGPVLEVSADVVLSENAGYGIYSFTTGDDDLTFTFDVAAESTLIGTTIRIYKYDDSNGTVTIYDSEGAEIMVLMNEMEHIDIKYISETKYLRM